MTKRILIVSHHFYPDAAVGAKRMSELVRHLCSEGHEVVVVAAKPASHNKVDPALQLDLANLRHIRIPQPPKLLPPLLRQIKKLRSTGGNGQSAPPPAAPVVDSGQRKESLIARLKRTYFSLEWLVDDKKLWATLVAARLLGFAFAKPFDAVVSSGPPMSAHLAVLLARPVLRSRWIMDLRDPWSNQEHHSELHTRFSRFLNRWLETQAVTAADVVTVTTPGYLQVLRQRYPDRQDQIELVLNGFERELPATPPPAGKLQLLYAGSLYYNRDPFPLLRGMRTLVERPDVDRGRVLVRLVGDCYAWNGISVTDWVEKNGLQDCISVEPPVPASEVGQLMAQASVLINFAQGQPIQIPAKMFDYLAARREILLITEPDSDTAWLARQANCARIVPPGDDAAMSATLLALYRDYVDTPQPRDLNATSLQAFSRKTQSERFLELLQAGGGVEQRVGL